MLSDDTLLLAQSNTVSFLLLNSETTYLHKLNVFFFLLVLYHLHSLLGSIQTVDNENSS